MEIALNSHPLESVDADALVVVVFEGERDPRFAEAYSDLYECGEIGGKRLETVLLHRPHQPSATMIRLGDAREREQKCSVE